MASFATNLGSLLTRLLLQGDHHHAAELRKELSKIKLKFAAVHHVSPGSTFGTWYSCAQTPYTSHISMGYVSWHIKLKNMRFRSDVKKWLPSVLSWTFQFLQYRWKIWLFVAHNMIKHNKPNNCVDKTQSDHICQWEVCSLCNYPRYTLFYFMP